jgi:hypothetical protein
MGLGLAHGRNHNKIIALQQSECRAAQGDPDFLYAALEMTACAAFIKESRMNFANANQPHRKSWGSREKDEE